MTETGELKMCISIEGFKEKKRALWKYGHEKYANKSLITAEHCTVYQNNMWTKTESTANQHEK